MFRNLCLCKIKLLLPQTKTCLRNAHLFGAQQFRRGRVCEKQICVANAPFCILYSSQSLGGALLCFFHRDITNASKWHMTRVHTFKLSIAFYSRESRFSKLAAPNFLREVSVFEYLLLASCYSFIAFSGR